MSLQSTAVEAVRVTALSSPASLALAAPVVTSDPYGTSSHTDAHRTGLYFGSVGVGARQIGIVVDGTERGHFYADGGIQLGEGTYGTSPGVHYTQIDANLHVVQPLTSTGGFIFHVDGNPITGLAASTEQHDVAFGLERIVTWETGDIPVQRAIHVTRPTYAFDGPSAIGRAVTLAIAGPPLAGMNATITATWSLWVEEGGACIGTLAVPAAPLAGVKLQTWDTENSYLQNNIQNLSVGNAASCDWVATTNDGTDSSGFIDMGINGSGFSQAGWTINGPRDGYLYTVDTNLAIGAAGASAYLSFFAGGTLAANEYVRVYSDGGVQIGGGSYGSSPGYGRLIASPYGTDNTAIGYRPMNTAMTGNGNIAIGSYTLASISSGIGNIMLGTWTGWQLSTGSFNVGIGTGYTAGNITTGSNNVSVGYACGGCTGAATNNTAVGAHALQTCAGNDNCGFGQGAGYAFSSGSGNVAIGSFAAYSMTTGDNNIIIGPQAGYGGTQLITASNSIAIGASTTTSASNQIVIGNASHTQTIFNTGATSFFNGATENMRIFADGGVQLGGTYGSSPGANYLLVYGTTIVRTASNHGIRLLIQNSDLGQVLSVADDAAVPNKWGLAGASLNIGPISMRSDGSNCGFNFGSAVVGASVIFNQGSVGGTFNFYTTPTTLNTLVEQVRIFGDGGVQLGGTYGSSPGAGALRFGGATSGGASIKAAAVAGSPATLVLPTTSGASGNVLSTDGSGNLSWVAPASGTITGSGTATQVTYWTGASAVSGSNGFAWDATNRRVGISDSSTLFAPLVSLHLSKDSNTGMRADTYSSTAAATAGVQFYKARGTAASPAAIQSGDVMGFVGVYGYYTGGSSGFSNQSRAKIEFLAANTWSDTSQGASVGLWTTATGAVAATERIRLYADGGTQISGTGANWGTSPGNGVLTVMQNQYLAPLAGTVIQAVGSNNVKARIEVAAFQPAGGAQTAYASFTGRSARGPANNPSATQSGDTIVAVSACGFGATAWPSSNRGLFHINAAETWTDTVQGTYIGFDTTAAGGIVTSEKVRIFGNGGVQIGGGFSTSGPGANTLLVSANTATTLAALPAGTRISAVGADGQDARVMVTAYGTGVKSAHSSRLARGTSASPTAVQSSDLLAEYGGWGYGATGFSSAARGILQIFAAENWTDAAQGTRIGFFTTAPTTTTTSEKMRVFGDGGVQVGGTFATSPGAGAFQVSRADDANYAGFLTASEATVQAGTSSDFVRPQLRLGGSTGPKTWIVYKSYGAAAGDGAGANAFSIGYNTTGNINALTTAFTALTTGQVTVPFMGVGTNYKATLGTVAKLTVNPSVTSDNAAAAQINTGADANKGLVIQRNSVTQTANLLEIQTSAGSPLVGVYADGGMQIGGTFGTSPGAGAFQVGSPGFIQSLFWGNDGGGNRIFKLDNGGGGGYVSIQTDNGANAHSTIQSNRNMWVYASSLFNWCSANTDYITFGCANTNTELMRIFGDGGVQIGGTFGTSPGAGNVGIHSGSTTSAALTIANPNGATNSLFTAYAFNTNYAVTITKDARLDLRDSWGLTWANGDVNWAVGRNIGAYTNMVVSGTEIENVGYGVAGTSGTAQGYSWGWHNGNSVFEIETAGLNPRVWMQGALGINIIPDDTVCKLSIKAGATTVKGAVIQAFSALQTANMLEVQNSVGTPMLSVTAAGALTFAGSTSGSASIKAAAVAGAPATLVLPTTSGSSGNVLSTDGSGNLSWATAATIGGSIANTQVAYGSGTNTIQGSAGFTFDGTSVSAPGFVATSYTAGCQFKEISIEANNAAPNKGVISVFIGGSLDSSTDGGGVAWVNSHNSPGNRQLTLMASEQYNNSLYSGFRYICGFAIPTIDGVSNDGSVVRNFALGQSGSLVGIGFDCGSWYQTDILAQLHLKCGDAARVASIVQGHAGQTADLQRWETSAAVQLVGIYADGGMQIGGTFGTSPGAGVLTVDKFYRTGAPQSVSASATITSGRVKFTGSTVSQTLTLPAGVSGTDCFIRNAGTVSVTVARAGSDTIEGSTTFVLEPGEAIGLTFIGTDWTVF